MFWISDHDETYITPSVDTRSSFLVQFLYTTLNFFTSIHFFSEYQLRCRCRFSIHRVLDSSTDEIWVHCRKCMFEGENRGEVTIFPFTIERIFSICESSITHIHIPLSIDEVSTSDWTSSYEREWDPDTILHSLRRRPRSERYHSSIWRSCEWEHCIEAIELEIDIGFTDDGEYSLSEILRAKGDYLDCDFQSLIIQIVSRLSSPCVDLRGKFPPDDLEYLLLSFRELLLVGSYRSFECFLHIACWYRTLWIRIAYREDELRVRSAVYILIILSAIWHTTIESEDEPDELIMFHTTELLDGIAPDISDMDICDSIFSDTSLESILHTHSWYILADSGESIRGYWYGDSRDIWPDESPPELQCYCSRRPSSHEEVRDGVSLVRWWLNNSFKECFWFLSGVTYSFCISWWNNLYTPYISHRWSFSNVALCSIFCPICSSSCTKFISSYFIYLIILFVTWFWVRIILFMKHIFRWFFIIKNSIMFSLKSSFCNCCSSSIIPNNFIY